MRQYAGKANVRFEVLSREEALDLSDQRGLGEWDTDKSFRITRERTRFVEVTFSHLSSGWTAISLGHVWNLHTWSLGDQFLESEMVEEFWYGDVSDVQNETVRNMLELCCMYIAKGIISGEAAEDTTRSVLYNLYATSPRFNAIARKEMPHWSSYNCEREWGSCPKRLGIIDLDRSRGEWVAIYDVDEDKEQFYQQFSWRHRYPGRISSEQLRKLEDRLIRLATAVHGLVKMAEQQEADREAGEEIDDEEDAA